MKRYGYLFEQIIDFENLVKAHYNARKGKRWYKEVKMVDSNIYYYIDKIYQSLKNKSFKTSDYSIFTKKESNKERLIYRLPYYPDRIVQWAILQILEPYFIRTMILDTYSAIPERGIHFGLRRVRKALKDRKNTPYCLKLDIRKYYQSIPHETLKQLLARMFKDKNLLGLLGEIIDSTDGDRGIPIGNYTSQYFGNFYLSYFDHWMKETRRVQYYFRYMDDIVILHKNKKYLHWLRKEIDWYLKSKLGLEIKKNWQVFPVDVRGIDFLGYRIFHDYSLLRTSIKKKYIRKMTKIIRKEYKKKNLESCIGSYNGWLNWCDSYRLKTKYLLPARKEVYNGKINNTEQLQYI